MRPRIKVLTLAVADLERSLVANQAELDVLMQQAERAGARVTDPARDRFWGGNSGYFQDPDGHLWEIAWNPALNAGE